jgi:AcrR family transcriptional regulator
VVEGRVVEGQLVETSTQPGTAVTRERLTKERVVRAAVDLADRDGNDALSMRNLAQDLGVAPMSLYKHVANKDELLDGMVEIVFGEVERPTGADWKAALRARAWSMRTALLRHPWAIAQMEARTAGPANLRHRDAVMRCLRETAGLSIPMALHAYSLADSYVYGYAFQQTAMGSSGVSAAAVADRAATRARAEEELPYLDELLAALGTSGFDFDREFDFGLDLLLDSIERLRG